MKRGGEIGKAISDKRKATRQLRHTKHGHSYTRKSKRVGKALFSLRSVVERDITPKTIEQLRRAKRGKKATEAENPMVTNINEITNCGKFHLSDLMSKPIKYTKVIK